jgi:hypothetical protein
VSETCSTHGGGRCVCRVLVGRSEWKSSLGNLREMRIDGANWIRLAQDRVFVNTVMNLRVP